MKFLKTLWQFSRPHTIIGSSVSITALFIIAWADRLYLNPENHLNAALIWGVYLPTLISALACNIYIVGLNQIQDVGMDKINKPDLPLAAGTLTMPQAKAIIIVCLFISLAIAAIFGWFFFTLIATIIAIGTAYSLPTWKFKKHHAMAAISITVVRGILVNMGMMVHFLHVWNPQVYELPFHIIPLTIFVVGFSLGIAWFKDIPDTVGDAEYKIKTLALTISPKKALNLGVLIVSLSYIQVILFGFFVPMPINKWFLIGSHALLLIAFLFRSFKLDLQQHSQIRSFYMFFWGLFFLEYIIYTLAYWI